MTARQPAEHWSSWQAMDSGRLLLFAAAGMLTVAAVAHTATVHIKQPAVNVAVAFGILIALGELLRLALPGGPEAAPLAPHRAAGRPVGVTGMASRLVAVSCVAFIFRSLTGIHLIVSQWWLAASVMTVLLVFGCLIDAVIGALIRADDLGARFGVALWDEMRVQ